MTRATVYHWWWCTGCEVRERLEDLNVAAERSGAHVLDTGHIVLNVSQPYPPFKVTT